LKELLLSFEIVAPIFLLIFLGYFLKRIKLLSKSTIGTMNKILFNVLFPVLIFNSLYSATFEQAFNLRVIIFTISYLLIVFALAMIIIPRLEPQNAKKSVLIQGWFRGFTLLFGFPIVSDLCGPESTALLALVVALAVPLRNVLAVITLELYSDTKPSIRVMLKNIILNPLIIACAAGLAAMAFEFDMPTIIKKPMEDIAKVASPIALILLGGFFEFSKVKNNLKQILIGVLGRLVITPVIFMGAAILLGFAGIELASLLALCCVPIGTSTFVMSHQMGGDSELAVQLIVIGTIVSAVTIFLWIFALKQLALI